MQIRNGLLKIVFGACFAVVPRKSGNKEETLGKVSRNTGFRCCFPKVYVYVLYLNLNTELLAYFLRNGIFVHHIVHGVGSDKGFCHVPDAFVVTRLTP